MGKEKQLSSQEGDQLNLKKNVVKRTAAVQTAEHWIRQARRLKKGAKKDVEESKESPST